MVISKNDSEIDDLIQSISLGRNEEEVYHSYFPAQYRGPPMKKPHEFETVYLSLGSNMGESEEIIRSCMHSLSKIPQVINVQCADLYITSPVQMDDPSCHFINSAVSLQTSLSPHELKLSLQDIEQEHGKIPKARHAPRPLDIDIILFGQQTVDTPLLTIPHPRWMERLFVLTPLADLCDEIHTPSGLLHLPSLITSHSNPHNERIQRLVPRKIALC